MSGLDLTEAIEAAAEILMREMDCGMTYAAGDCPNCGTVPCGPHPETWYCQTHAIDSDQSPVCGTVDELLTDIVPIIARQVAEKIAAEIEARVERMSSRPITTPAGGIAAAVRVALAQGMKTAAKIAREVAR